MSVPKLIMPFDNANIVEWHNLIIELHNSSWHNPLSNTIIWFIEWHNIYYHFE